tara:strand:+ start:651 stop:929 length:279 start_codon:yes stop_codon:yes gene_type:complete
MTKQEYNGWTNYETWNYKLWLDNNQPTYDAVRTLAKKHNDAYDLSIELSKVAHDNAPLLEASFYSDVLNASIREVNFFEIAESYLEEIKEVA